MGLFEEHYSDLIEKKQCIVKEQGKFTTVMYSIHVKDDIMTVAVSKDTTLDYDVLTLRIICDASSVTIEDCNKYNANSSGPIAFLTDNKFVVSLTVEPKSVGEIDKKISELIVVSKYLRKC